MINFSEEIEQCLKRLRNTNNKEQNFQGILFQYFRERYADKGYVVEMETNVHDDHISFFKGITNFEKKEIDLLIYSKDYSEKYAAELKWIYHQDGSGKWTHLDNLPSFEQDVRFVKQLKDNAKFNQTCAVVVYDTDPEKQTKLRDNRRNKEAEDLYVQGIICGENFKVKDLYDYFKYHIVTFK